VIDNACVWVGGKKRRGRLLGVVVLLKEQANESMWGGGFQTAFSGKKKSKCVWAKRECALICNSFER